MIKTDAFIVVLSLSLSRSLFSYLYVQIGESCMKAGTAADFVKKVSSSKETFLINFIDDSCCSMEIRGNRCQSLESGIDLISLTFVGITLKDAEIAKIFQILANE